MVGYSLHQLLRYVAAHSGWHLLLPVMGDSQRVPNGAEALGELVDGAAVAADSGIANLRASVHLYPSCYPLSRRWPTGLSQSLSLTIKSAACEFPKLRAPCALIQAAHLMALVFPRRLLLQMPQPKPKHR